jgi:hypothetical protein
MDRLGRIFVVGCVALCLAVPSVGLAKKPPKPTPTPTPQPEPANPEIVYVAETVSRNKKNITYKIMLMDSDGSNQTSLLDCGETICGHPRFSPDGTKIVFVFGESIAIVGVDGADLRVLAILNGGTGQPDFSPVPIGGQYWIAYTDFDPQDPSSHQVFAVNEEGNTVVQMTFDPFLTLRKPSWSTDGFLLSVESGPAPSSSHAIVLEIDLPYPEPLVVRVSDLYSPLFTTNPQSFPCASWSPDASRIPGDYKFSVSGCEDTWIFDPGPLPFDYGPYLPEWHVDQIILESFTNISAHVDHVVNGARLSSDGAAMVYESCGDIYRIPTDGISSPTLLAAGGRYERLLAPDWK